MIRSPLLIQVIAWVVGMALFGAAVVKLAQPHATASHLCSFLPLHAKTLIPMVLALSVVELLVGSSLIAGYRTRESLLSALVLCASFLLWSIYILSLIHI